MNPKPPVNKYQPYPLINLPDRTWPSQVISKAPFWCSVDLRDGNQSLIEPMDSNRKLQMFHTLVNMGFKEIEVGFPSASETDFQFLRELIEKDHIPDDVTIQVLTQAREHLIDRTIESLAGAKKAILHLYNSTSTLQRRVVFNSDRDGVKTIATDGAKLVSDRLGKLSSDTHIRLQYSPESFTGTELDYALEVCEEVLQIWNASEDNKVIINLPATVEMSTPNIYADQIEWMHRNFSNRKAVILSLHPHNDRGTGIAATELGLMAGADRVEGTLFGNGERTGNVDIITLGLNMLTQGTDPQLDMSDIQSLVDVAEFCNQLPVHQRHPYAGQLVHTAFSGSHQDAIRKGIEAANKSNDILWQVPYLPIDPADIGRTYEAIIRVNSQSGKAGSAWLLETEHHIRIPRSMEVEFSQLVQTEADKTGAEITADKIWEIYNKFYVNLVTPYKLISFQSHPVSRSGGTEQVSATVSFNGTETSFVETGNGPISAFVNGFRKNFDVIFRLADFGQNTRSSTSQAEAAAYVELKVPDDAGSSVFGAGIDTSITQAPIKALISAINRI
ncbi:2-isopropylmalate synthase [Alphaproteobacteria bacterium]|nr:2-isopropylmalate synthase [Alphaproteobacteria bacterium]MDA9189871.1 2-isopropylmalate synthase [Alphaproteobacteria bacterium]MDC0461640.1 2-isopropylmalate synthase [Alphaproteobacteria bacterium]MDC3312260.1 2-isopropylmalate synthase [Alphaproteobacteria bacterium]